MAKFTAFRGKLMMDNTDFNQSLAASGKEVQKLHTTTKKEMRGVDDSFKTSAKEAGIFFGAITGGIAVSINGLKDFERELLNVQYVLTDVTDSAVDDFGRLARETAKLTGAPATMIAQIQTQLASAGYQSQAEIDRLSRMVGGFADATGRTDASLSDKLTAGNIATGRRIDDLLNIYAGAGKRTRGGMTGGVDLIAQFMPALAPTAQSLGFSAEETAALLSTASWHTPRPRRAGSGMRMILEEAVKPDSKFAKNFADTFGESFQAATEGQGMRGFIDAMGKALDRWGSRDFIGSFGSAETGSLAVSLLGDTERLFGTLAEASVGDTVAKVMEDYEGSVNEVSGVLKETASDFRYEIGLAFREDAIEWMRTLTEMLENDNLLEAAVAFLDAATVVSEPLRDVAVPMTAFAAALLSFNIPGTDLNLASAAGLYFGTRDLMRMGKAGKNIGNKAAGANYGTGTGRMMAGGGALMASGAGVASSILGPIGWGLLANETIRLISGFDALGTTIDGVKGSITSLTGEQASDKAVWDKARREAAIRYGLTEDQVAGVPKVTGNIGVVDGKFVRRNADGSYTNMGLLPMDNIQDATPAEIAANILPQADINMANRYGAWGTRNRNTFAAEQQAQRAYAKDQAAWERMMENPLSLLTTFGNDIGIARAFSEDFGRIDTEWEQRMWDAITAQLPELRQIARNTSDTAANTDPANEGWAGDKFIVSPVDTEQFMVR